MIDTDVAFMDCYFEERGGRWKMPEADSEVPSFISTSLLIGYPDRSVTSLSLSLSLCRFITSGGNVSYVHTRRRTETV